MATQLKETQEQGAAPANEDQNVETGERDFDAEARERGWVSKEEFLAKPNADESRWVDAQTFIERTDTVMPLLKADRDRLKRELAELKRGLRQATKHFEGAEARGFERAKAEIEARIEAATEKGDVAAVKEAMKDMEGLKPGHQPRYSETDLIEAFDEFRDTNAWYDRGALGGATELEINARLHFDRVMERELRNIKQGEEPPPEEFFASVVEKVKEKYPALGSVKQQVREKPASDVAGQGGGRPQRNSRTYDNLPPEAKAQCDKWIKAGIINAGSEEKSRALYAKDFDWTKWQQEAAR